MDQTKSNSLNSKAISAYSSFSLCLLAYALLIILWGAWVRISGSGDGCGQHWPLCHGQIWIDQSFTEQAKTWIELAHRVKSGLFGILVLVLFFYSKKIFPKGHHARKSALLTLVFTITEALLGAKLVLLGLVTTDDSYLRAISMSLHLGNTLLLLFFLCACWDSKNTFSRTDFPWPNSKMWLALLSLFLIAICGAWAALASTLFPSESLLAGLKQDFSSDSHWLLRIRIIHPILAVILASIAFFLIQKIKESSKESSCLKLAKQAQIFIFAAILIGLTTLLSASPTGFKLLHLLSADLAWISLARFSMLHTFSNKAADISAS